MTIPTLTAAAAKMFIRNKQALFFTFFMPVVIMTVFGLIGFDDVPKIQLGVVTDEPNAGTREFVERLKSIDAFEVSEGNEDDERAALDDGDRVLVAVLPDNLIPDPASGQPETQTITLYKNTAQEQQAQTGISILSQILGQTNLAILQAPNLFSLDVQDVSVRDARYIDFLLPGIVAIAIMQMAVFSVSFLFVDYKEKGILKRLLATPMRPYQFVTANVIVRLAVAMSQVAVLIAIGVWLYSSVVVGSYLLIFFISALGGIMFLGMGFAISGLAKTVEAVPAIANLIVFPMFFLAGTFFPLESMPEWLQSIVQFLPLTYFTHALREVMSNGTNIAGIATDIYFMLGWSAILIFLANLSFSFEEKRIA